MNPDKDILQADVFDEERRLSLDELSELCGARSTLIIQLVEEGVLEPADLHASRWVFSGSCVRRVRTAIRLQRDLDVNLPGIALALELLEELESLRRRVR